MLLQDRLQLRGILSVSNGAIAAFAAPTPVRLFWSGPMNMPRRLWRRQKKRPCNIKNAPRAIGSGDGKEKKPALQRAFSDRDKKLLI
jgi:hypothetical protein